MSRLSVPLQTSLGRESLVAKVAHACLILRGKTEPLFIYHICFLFLYIISVVFSCPAIVKRITYFSLCSFFLLFLNKVSPKQTFVSGIAFRSYLSSEIKYN